MTRILGAIILVAAAAVTVSRLPVILDGAAVFAWWCTFALLAGAGILAGSHIADRANR